MLLKTGFLDVFVVSLSHKGSKNRDDKHYYDYDILSTIANSLKESKRVRDS